MHSNLYTIEAIYSARDKCYKIQMEIPDIEWLLTNQTNREIRSHGVEIGKNDNTVCIQVKVQFTGDDNELIKIYFAAQSSVFLSWYSIFVEGNDRGSSVKVQRDVTVLKNKWQLISVLLKKDCSRSNAMIIYLLICHKHVTSVVCNQEKELYPKEELDESIPSNLITGLANLLMNKDCSDVTVKSVEGDEFAAHKCILSTRSTVFKAHFDHNTVESQTNVIASPFETKVVRNVLSYLYTDEAPDIDEVPREILIAADFYQLTELKRLCETVLVEQLTVKNAIETLELANEYRATYLTRKTLEFISDGLAVEITITEGWKKLQSAEIIKSIFEAVVVK